MFSSLLLMPMAGRFLDWIGHQYQYVYLLGSLLAFAGLGTGGIVYRRFVAFGGPSSYKAPPGIRPKMLTTSKERMQDMYRKFTLLELLIAIAIIAILVSMLLPGLSRARENARSTACVNTLKTLGFGIASYTNDNQDYLPPMCYSENAGGTPYFHQSLMGTNPLDGTWGYWHHVKGMYISIADLRCPSMNGNYPLNGENDWWVSYPHYARLDKPPHPEFFKIAVCPHVMIALEEIHLDTGIHQIHKGRKHPDITFRDNIPVLVPEIPDIPQKIQGTGPSGRNGRLLPQAYRPHCRPPAFLVGGPSAAVLLSSELCRDD